MSTASRRVALPQPPNGSQLIDQVLAGLKQDLSQFFKIHLAYPNATFRINWAANFYSTPMHYEGQSDILVRTDNLDEATLINQGASAEMEMGSIDLGLSTGSSPATVRQGLASSSTAKVPTESAGRRDINARRGVGVDFLAGSAVNANLAKLTDDSAIKREVAKVVSDLEVSPDQQPLAENTIIVPTNEAK